MRFAWNPGWVSVDYIACKQVLDGQSLIFSPAAEDSAFAEKFSSGYLFGQILYKYDLQADFCLFSKGTYVSPSPFTMHVH